MIDNDLYWKNKAFEAYTKFVKAVNFLDFKYGIKLADSAYIEGVDFLEANANIHNLHNPEDSDEAGAWHKLLVDVLEYAKLAVLEKEDYRRVEKYYGTVNMFTDFIECNEHDIED